jgi:hypothetical protein
MRVGEQEARTAAIFWCLKNSRYNSNARMNHDSYPIYRTWQQHIEPLVSRCTIVPIAAAIARSCQARKITVTIEPDRFLTVKIEPDLLFNGDLRARPPF